MKNMKKLIAVLAIAVLLLAGCSVNTSNTTENTQTYNGISMTERTVTENGKTTTEIIYTDADGKQMDEAAGKEAFEAAKAEFESSGN